MFTAQGLYYASSSSDGVSACTSPSTQALQSNWCTSTAVMSASGSSSPVWKSTSESGARGRDDGIEGCKTQLYAIEQKHREF